MPVFFNITHSLFSLFHVCFALFFQALIFPFTGLPFFSVDWHKIIVRVKKVIPQKFYEQHINDFTLLKVLVLFPPFYIRNAAFSISYIFLILFQTFRLLISWNFFLYKREAFEVMLNELRIKFHTTFVNSKVETHS